MSQAEGFIDIELSRALEIDGAKVNALRMREPTVEDQLAAEAIQGTDSQREIQTFANLCSIAPADIRRLPLRDYKRVQKAFLNFLD